MDTSEQDKRSIKILEWLGLHFKNNVGIEHISENCNDAPIGARIELADGSSFTLQEYNGKIRLCDNGKIIDKQIKTFDHFCNNCDPNKRLKQLNLLLEKIVSDSSFDMYLSPQILINNIKREINATEMECEINISVQKHDDALKCQSSLMANDSILSLNHSDNSPPITPNKLISLVNKVWDKSYKEEEVKPLRDWLEEHYSTRKKQIKKLRELNPEIRQTDVAIILRCSRSYINKKWED